MVRKKNSNPNIPGLSGIPKPTDVIVINNVKPNKSKKNKKKKSKKLAQKLNRPLAEIDFFRSRLLAPDVFGPFRQPRMGGSVRTGLGIDLTDTSLTGSATNLVQGGQALSIYSGNSIQSWAVASETTALGAAANTSVGSQFPAPSQIADINLTSCNLVIYYIGNPLNVTGEVIIGSCIPIATTATYQSLFYYPGTLKFPIAELINKPKRVSFRKLSPIADEFVTVNSGNADVDLPFVFTSGQFATGTLKILVTRTWEYRSTTTSGSVVSYERVGSSHSKDVAAYQDARADVAELNSPVTDAIPDGWSQSLTSMLGLGGVTGAMAGYHLVRNKMAGRMSQTQSPTQSSLDQMTPMAEYLSRFGGREEL